MKNVLLYFRVSEWYDSKIPLAMATGLYALLYEQQTLEKQNLIIWYVAYFAFCVIYFAFNYLLNDYSDIEEDLKAGKKKTIQSVDRRYTFLVLLILPVIGTLELFVVTGCNLTVLSVSIIVYFLGISYSAKGIRMKERGIWGLIFSAFAQRNTPVLITFSFLYMRFDHFICWMLICFVNGIRYILIHQYIDRENDKKAGIHTFVLDKNLSIKKGIWCSMVLETVSVIWLFAVEWKVMVVVGIIYIGICILDRKFTENVLKESYFYSYACVPLEDLYNVFIPLFLTCGYAVKSGYFFLIPLSVFYLIVPLCKKIYMPMMAVWKILHQEMG